MSKHERVCDNTFCQFTDAMFERHGRTGSDFHFVQVGTNDGITFDPLYRWIREYRWSGVLVEPVSPLLLQAESNYQGNENLTFVNAAIASHVGHVPLFSVRDEAGLPLVARLLGSLDREVVMKHAGEIPDLDRRIETLQVPCMTLQELWLQQPIPGLDLFHVDAEGADFEIVRQLDTVSCIPSMIMCEHKHLSSNKSDELRSWFREHGYDILTGPFDDFAYLPKMLTNHHDAEAIA